MATSRFANALILFAKESPDNVTALETLRTQAFGLITSGAGEIVQDVSGTMNGKSFTFEVKMDCTELFTLLTEILESLSSEGTTNGRASSFDFRSFRNY